MARGKKGTPLPWSHWSWLGDIRRRVCQNKIVWLKKTPCSHIRWKSKLSSSKNRDNQKSVFSLTVFTLIVTHNYCAECPCNFVCRYEYSLEQTCRFYFILNYIVPIWLFDQRFFVILNELRHRAEKQNKKKLVGKAGITDHYLCTQGLCCHL